MPDELKNQTIGYLIPQFPGQTHIFFWREIAALEARGVDVALFSTRSPPAGLISHEWSQEAMDRTTYLGAIKPLEALKALLSIAPGKWMFDVWREGVGAFKDVLITLAAAQTLRDDCARRGITHVHVHSCGRAALIAMFAQLMGGPSYSLTLHGPMSDYGSLQGLKWRHADFATIITQKLTAEARLQLGNDFPDRVALQPMGVDTDVLKRPTAYIPPKTDAPIQLFACGRLNVVKGHQDLLSAVRNLVDQGLDIQLEIAGEDDDGGQGYHRELAAHLADLNLEGNAKLLGAISAEAVLQKLTSAHIFILASWHEPLGVAYMEAMSCGTPTIGTNAGGVPELIRDGVDGILVSPQSPKELANAIQDLISTPSKAESLSVAGRARIVGQFHSDIGAETLLSLINEGPD
ncbi:exopolysaccharide biosynthesis GT4 family glycosyltransferase EpsE [Cochlodiniinecator piscidefendens]|uniref:exopolysaccharide biosynthesis GT4 family glycosyltransferase EpsE n=1 Tax=Cochlodiniinecator piscidefendens TaxID=2715756 RepID=UPI001408AC67|nr:exopolysaccharide biosynthesis GT4 family glycosyltransferase EpsE [Cochlodiniinecator piscidefendens]